MTSYKYITSSFQSAAKLNGNIYRTTYTVIARALVFLAGCIMSAAAQEGILAPQRGRPALTHDYATASAFLADTKNGVIPEMLHRQHGSSTEQALGSSLVGILEKEYHFDFKRTYSDGKTYLLTGLLVSLTRIEMDHQEYLPKVYSSDEDRLFGAVGARPPFTDSRAAFDTFAAEYVKAVKEYMVQKEDATQQRTAAREEQRNKAVAAQKEAEERRQKRNAIFASPEYKLWLASRKVAQGGKMIQTAQAKLDHDDAVTRESGVSDLAARRAAGEQMVMGKKLVDDGFREYKELGGTAASPDKVIPGPDPSAAYR
jgi:hypothetical protein